MGISVNIILYFLDKVTWKLLEDAILNDSYRSCLLQSYLLMTYKKIQDSFPLSGQVWLLAIRISQNEIIYEWWSCGQCDIKNYIAYYVHGCGRSDLFWYTLSHCHLWSHSPAFETKVWYYSRISYNRKFMA